VKALLLTPGAGSDRNHSTLIALDEALTERGVVVRRVDFPYRIAGRRAPDRAPVLLECVRTEAEALCQELGIEASSLVIGGRSMGGRICSMAAASKDVKAGGVLLISYPLHPPGKPERARIEHLPQLDVPVLAISGTRDSFGTPVELDAALVAIPGPLTMHYIAGGRHELRGVDDEIASTVLKWWETPLLRPLD
jgi:predicted alpha/beta-hydrolase family hydrolase